MSVNLGDAIRAIEEKEKAIREEVKRKIDRSPHRKESSLTPGRTIIHDLTNGYVLEGNKIVGYMVDRGRGWERAEFRNNGLIGSESNYGLYPMKSPIIG